MKWKFNGSNPQKDRANWVMGFIMILILAFLNIPFSFQTYAISHNAHQLASGIALSIFCAVVSYSVIRSMVIQEPDPQIIEKEVKQYKFIQIPSTRDVTDTQGYVYILRADEGQYYKIGKTAYPDDRRRTFDVKLPFAVEYELLLQTEDMHQLERDLHRIYHDKRINGEWFALTTDDIQFIRKKLIQSKP